MTENSSIGTANGNTVDLFFLTDTIELVGSPNNWGSDFPVETQCMRGLVLVSDGKYKCWSVLTTNKKITKPMKLELEKNICVAVKHIDGNVIGKCYWRESTAL